MSDLADGDVLSVRAEHVAKPGWADRFHDTMKRKKKGEK
jgi:bifunctional UDP-N-acetylglucosamine pyrophosphorylase / glucosamine-1-phosphate N-acetyltransferase